MRKRLLKRLRNIAREKHNRANIKVLESENAWQNWIHSNGKHDKPLLRDIPRIFRVLMHESSAGFWRGSRKVLRDPLLKGKL